ncbi:MAG TPA: aldo/keto reductase [Acidimicrobiales bacterium]
MRQTTLGRSGLQVSRIAFGTWQLGGDWGATEEDQATAAIRRAADRGVTLFDTAQAYGFGASERFLAKALSSYPREEMVIATKGGLRPTAAGGVARDASPEWIRQGVDQSLEALGTDYIDLLQVHWPDPATPLEETAGALGELVAQGKIRHVGVSNFDTDQMGDFAMALPVETLQPPYHLLRRSIEADILPYADAHDIGVLVYGPLAHGLLSGDLHEDTRFAPGDWRGTSPVFKGESFRRNLDVVDQLSKVASEAGVSLSQMAIAWTLSNPAVDVAIVGTRNPAHLDDALSAGSLNLGEDVLDRIDQIVHDAVPIDGPSPEAMPED